MTDKSNERGWKSGLSRFLEAVQRRLRRRDSKNLFSRRADDYARFRPSYPMAAVRLLQKKLKLNAKSRVADVGSGTGIFSKLLLGTGALVYGVEPNGPMRKAAEKDLARFKHFHSVKGDAEDTTLTSGSLDLITAAQSFHWFHLKKTRREFRRILRPHGWVCILWNTRVIEGDFLRRLEEIHKRYRNNDPGDIYPSGRKVERFQKINIFFGKNRFKNFNFDHSLALTLEGLLGFFRSQSYMPLSGTPQYRAMAEEVGALFKKHQKKNHTRMIFHTDMVLGRLNKP